MLSEMHKYTENSWFLPCIGLALAKLTFRWNALVRVLTWIPSRCRHSAAQELPFSLSLNVLFGLASTITAANLYNPSSDGASVLLGIGLGLNSAAKQRVP